MDWAELDKEAVKLVDRKKIANLKQSATKELYESQDNFVALRDFKKYCDKKDKLFMYKINSSELNPSEPNYVFKTSTTKMRMASPSAKEADMHISKMSPVSLMVKQ